MIPNSNFYDFVQLMYYEQHKRKLLNASHHKPICDALTRVILGETKRLIINVPPRSGKTLFVSQMFPAFCMGLNPACSFILTSYSKTLASNNTYMIRELMRHEVYQSIFSDTRPIIKDDSQARDEFRTEAGGMVYGVGAGGTITGKGAGAMGDLFSGCFSYDTLVDTERGLMKIGDIVENEIDVRVWSLSDSGEKTLEGIDGYIKNPPEKLIDVHLSDGGKIRCTPWHEILTLNRGWVRADSLTAVDSLPSVDSAIKTLDPPEVADHVCALKARDRKPVFISAVDGVHNSYCLTVNPYNNFTIQQGIVVKNCILIDDISKPSDALSETMRANTIEWFRGTLESRKNSPDTPIIIIMQRLHSQDLAGWLLDGGNGEEWELLKIPALREDGSSFWPKQFPVSMLERLEKSNPYTFAGQYQQEPSPRGGGFFKPANIEIIDALPADIKWVRGWDLAATARGGDYTVGAKVGVKDGITYIADIRREQGSPDEVEKLIVSTAKMDDCLQSIPQDPGAAGKSVVAYLSKKLAGTRFKFSPETGDKATRAEPLAAQINVGNVKMLKADWNEVLSHELASFPLGNHDDIVDGLSRAYNETNTGGSALTTKRLF